MTKCKKDEMMKKVFDAFVAKYGKLYNRLDASIVYNYIEDEVEKHEDLTNRDIADIMNGAYKRIHTDNFLNDMFRCMSDIFGKELGMSATEDCECKEKECKENNPACECRTANIKSKHKYVSDTNELKTVKYLLPGVQKSNISIDIIGNEIRVCLDDVVAESPFINPDFKDVIQIEDDMDLDNMKAKLELGILTLTIPKKVKIEEKRTIKIN